MVKRSNILNSCSPSACGGGPGGACQGSCRGCKEYPISLKKSEKNQSEVTSSDAIKDRL